MQSHASIGFLVLVLLCGANAVPAGALPQHPMDALEDSEIVAAANILIKGGAAAATAVFQSVELREPPKQLVLHWRAGDPIPRAATVFFRQDKHSYRSIVNLSDGTFTAPVEIPASEGQIGFSISELIGFDFLLKDPAMQKALALRGFDTPEKQRHVLFAQMAAGSFGLPEESKRITRVQMYSSEGSGINLLTHPIEGLLAIVDLDEHKVLRVVDTGVIPVPVPSYNFDEASVSAQYGLRPPLYPIRISQPQGRNFTFEGNFVKWQKWRFHLRFERRSGTVISLVTYDGRSIMYQGSLAEAFVPYQDPDSNWYWRTFMDEGEMGFGAQASSMVPGLDVPENAVLRDAVVSAFIPGTRTPVYPLHLRNVLAVFERLTGDPAWRHSEPAAPGPSQYEGRAAVELVVRMIAGVGNYDYLVDWIFTQDGVIRTEISLTGIDVFKAVRSTTISDPTGPQDTAHGALVAPNLVATYHSHYFSFRLDLDVDGTDNSFVLGRLKIQPTEGIPRRGVWVVDDTTLDREKDGALNHDGSIWRIVNPSRHNAEGYDVGYILESEGDPAQLMDGQDDHRARFIEHDLWVTAYDPDQHYSAGDTPNQIPGSGGLPQYIEGNRNIRNTDIVLWLTLAFHHLPVSEDFPVLPVHRRSFQLTPAFFFDQNPSVDLRRAPFEPEK